MAQRGRGAGWIGLVLMLWASPGAAQLGGGSVLPRGAVAISVGGTSMHASKETAPRVVIGPASFPELGALQTGLVSFFAATDTSPATAFRVQPEEVALGAIWSGYTADRGALMLALAAGIARRLTVHVRVPLEQYEAVTEGVSAGVQLGLNPDTAGNRRILAAVSSELGNLGASKYLPTVTSRAGAELLARTRQRTGSALNLPSSPLREPALRGLLASLGLTLPEPADAPAPTLRLGDIEAGARLELLNTAPGYPYPDSISRPAYRATLGVLGRLRTAVNPLVAALTDAPSGSGGSVAEAELVTDVFWSNRVSAGASAGVAIAGRRQVRTQVPLNEQSAFPEIVTEQLAEREIGTRIRWQAVPRYRVTPTITLAGWYMGTASNLHAVGAQAGFSTLPLVGKSRAFPLEVSLGVLGTAVGSPRGTLVTVEGRTIAQAFGRR